MSTIHITNAKIINFDREHKDTLLKKYENEKGHFLLFRVMEERYYKRPLPYMIKVNNPDILQQVDKMHLTMGDYLTIDGEYDVKISEDKRQYVQITAFSIGFCHETWQKKQKEKQKEGNSNSSTSTDVSTEHETEVDLEKCDIFLQGGETL